MDISKYEYYRTKNGVLYHGDCLEILPHLEPVDLVLTDPPYETTASSWDVMIPLEPMWENITKISDVFIFTASQPFSSLLVVSGIEMFKHEWIWKKNRGSNFLNTVREPMKEHEHVLVFAKKDWVYNPQKQVRSGGGVDRANYKVKYSDADRQCYRKLTDIEHHKLSKMREPSSCQEFIVACGSEKVKHPNQKPLSLIKYLIETYSNKGDSILDFSAGSGTTAVSCEQLGRKWVAIEKEAVFCEISAKRIEAENRQLKIPGC